MPVTRRGVKRSSEVGDLRLSCKSYSWNFLGGVGIVRRIIIIIIFFGGVGIVRRIIIIIFFLGGVGIMRRSKMPVTRREVKRSSEVGDLRLSCKSYSWNFFFGGG